MMFWRMQDKAWSLRILFAASADTPQGLSRFTDFSGICIWASSAPYHWN